MLVDSASKIYEKPETGMYDAVVADVVNLGIITGRFGPKPKVRIVYLLTAKDSEGNYFRVMQQVTASMFEKSKLYGIVKDILGVAPELSGPTGSFELENLIGRNNQLVISKDTGPDKKVYANVKAIMPAKVSFVVPPAFVRDKDRKDKNTTTSAQTAAPAAAPAAKPPVVDDEDIPF